MFVTPCCESESELFLSKKGRDCAKGKTYIGALPGPAAHNNLRPAVLAFPPIKAFMAERRGKLCTTSI